MYIYRNLENVKPEVLYKTFSEVFSDYQIKIKLSFEEFQTMLKRRGFTPGISIGAFKEPGHEFVGFILNGMREWSGKLTAYDLGTGIIPSERRNGISRSMFQIVQKWLEQDEIEQYLLEVLQDNKAAFELYKKQGLSITRNYTFFKMKKSSFVPRKLSYETDCCEEIKASEWEQLMTFWDFSPSWQNSIDSILAVQDEFAYIIVRIDNKAAGYGIVEKKTGDIPQLAVQKEFRHKGIASDIIAALAQETQADVLSVINMDNTSKGTELFLQKSGFEQVGSQYEMMMKIK